MNGIALVHGITWQADAAVGGVFVVFVPSIKIPHAAPLSVSTACALLHHLCHHKTHLRLCCELSTTVFAMSCTRHKTSCISQGTTNPRDSLCCVLMSLPQAPCLLGSSNQMARIHSPLTGLSWAQVSASDSDCCCAPCWNSSTHVAQGGPSMCEAWLMLLRPDFC